MQGWYFVVWLLLLLLILMVRLPAYSTTKQGMNDAWGSMIMILSSILERARCNTWAIGSLREVVWPFTSWFFTPVLRRLRKTGQMHGKKRTPALCRRKALGNLCKTVTSLHVNFQAAFYNSCVVGHPIAQSSIIILLSSSLTAIFVPWICISRVQLLLYMLLHSNKHMYK